MPLLDSPASVEKSERGPAPARAASAHALGQNERRKPGKTKERTLFPAGIPRKGRSVPFTEGSHGEQKNALNPLWSALAQRR